jgi:aminodeoxyfutalosine deaminase
MTLITHTAGWVMIDPWTIFKDGFVQMESGKIKAFGQGRAPLEYGRLIDHGPGVIMPALVNVHAHLELSALKNKTNTRSGFMDWIKSIIALRDFIGTDELLSAADKGIAELLDTGTLFIGEISTLGITKQIFMDSALNGVWFKEQIGLYDVPIECAHIAPLKKISMSGHAPHTIAPSLLVQIKQITRQHDLPFSIHLSESIEEVDFLTTGKGTWADLLNDRGIDSSQWNFTDGTPVQYVDKLGILDEKTIAVHVLHSSGKELELLGKKGVTVCICPRSNMKLHGRLPDLTRMLDKGIRPCLGTDSLASNDSLNMFDEMKFTAEVFPGISPKEILAMATVNGSIALGVNKHAGSLDPDKNASFLYVPVDASDPKTLLEKLIYQDFKEKVKLFHHDTL